jgi:hypothetical protein
MDTGKRNHGKPDRRGFLKTAGAGLMAAGAILSPAAGAAPPLSEKEKLARIAANT